MSNRKRALFLFLFLLPRPLWGKVFVRWTAATLPGTPLGIRELVIPWNRNRTALLHTALAQGYRVYAEVPVQQVSDAFKWLAKESIEGVVVDAGNGPDAAREIEKLRSAHSKVKMLVSLDGKQPQMRGQTVVTRNGVLQVSSPTAQPWLDSNLAMVRFHQESRPGETLLYTFAWELKDTLQQQNGPSVEDYSLAIAESGAIHADLLLSVHQKLQKALLDSEPAAWSSWKKLIPYMQFALRDELDRLHPWSNVAVIAGDYDTAYEPMNLMARHNIPFRIVSGEVTERALQGVTLVAALTAPDQPGIRVLNAFAQEGGTVILVDANGKYPWHSSPPIPAAEHAVSYAAGKGRVIELSEPVSDPETFAQDLRRVAPKGSTLISLWNALTTTAVPYRDDRNGRVVVELVNFAEEPMRIQVQVKGVYSSARYETPDRGCCQDLSPVQHDGFTDFVVPSLAIAGRVHLEAAGSREPSHRK